MQIMHMIDVMDTGNKSRLSSQKSSGTKPMINDSAPQECARGSFSNTLWGKNHFFRRRERERERCFLVTKYYLLRDP